RRQDIRTYSLADRDHVLPTECARHPLVAEGDHRAQIGQAFGVELSRRRGVEFRTHLAQQCSVIRGFVRWTNDERGAARLTERIVELSDTVGRIDVDKNRPDLGRGELCDDPLGVVWRPNADPVALLDSQGEETAGEAIARVLKLGVAESHPLM